MAKYPFIVDGQDFTDLFHKYGYEVIGEMNRFIDAWAARQGFESLDEFRGRMDYGSSEGDFYQRVQYMKYFPHDTE